MSRKQIAGILVFILLFVCLCLGAAGSAAEGNDPVFTGISLELEPVREDVKPGETLEIRYTLNRNLPDGSTWDGDVELMYWFHYVNETTDESGKKQTMSIAAVNGGSGITLALTEDTGILSMKVERSDYAAVELRVDTNAMLNGEPYYYIGGNELYHNEQYLTVPLSGVTPRSVPTCTFTLPETPLEYGQEYEIGYSIKGLEKTDQLDGDFIGLELYIHDQQSGGGDYRDRAFFDSKNSLSGQYKFKPIDGDYVSVYLYLGFRDQDGTYMGTSFETPRMAVRPLNTNQTGWFEKDGKKYYADINGNLYRGYRGIITEGSWEGSYCFDENGALVTNDWFLRGDEWYYADQDGHPMWPADYDDMQMCFAGIVMIDGLPYYFRNQAAQPYSFFSTDTDHFYRSGERGRIYTTGWHPVENPGDLRYYSDENGVLYQGWKTIDGSRYYFQQVQSKYTVAFMGHNVGEMAVGIRQIDGKWYHFGTDGKLRGEVSTEDAIQVPLDTAEIQNEAFAGTDAIFFSIPENVKTIGSRAFADLKQGCAGIFLEHVPETVAPDAFKGSRITVITHSTDVILWGREHDLAFEYISPEQ